MHASLFDLAVAMNEAVENGSFHSGGTKVRLMDAPEDINEAIAYCNFQVMQEAVSGMQYSNTVNEMMTEAVMYNPDAVGPMAEAGLGGIKEAFKKFFTKIKSAVQTIIARVKEFFAKITGKCDKFVKLIEPRIKAAQGTNKKLNDTTVSMHKWDFDKLMNKPTEDIYKDFGSADEISDAAVALIGDNFDKFLGKYDNQMANIVQQIDDQVEKKKEQLEEFKKSYYSDYGNASSLEEAIKHKSEEITNGDKTDMKVSEIGIDKMMNFLKTVNKERNKIDSTWNKIITKLTKLEKDVNTKMEKVVSNFNKTGTADGKGNKDEMKGVNSAYTAAYERLVRASYEIMTTSISMTNSLCSHTQSMQISLIKQCAKECMNALSKVAGSGKEPKD